MDWKKAAGIGLALLLVLAAMGCGNSASPQTPPAQESEGGTPTGGEGASGSSGTQDELAKLYEAAKAEGSVVFWSANDVTEVQKFQEKFNEKYPGIKIDHFEIQPGEAIERMIAESSAGQVNVDVFDTPLTYLPPLIERDMIETYDYPGVFGIKATHFDNRLVGIYHLSVPIVYNTNLVSEADVPKSWEDLLDPKWKGQKILVESRGIAFPILAQEWGEEKALDYLNQLLAQEPLIIKGGTPTLQSISNGEVAIAMGTYAYKVEQNKKKGAPIEWARVSPIPAMTYVAGVPKNAPHPNAALLFAGWLASEDGLKAREEITGMGMLTDTENISAIGREMKANNLQVIPEREDFLEEGARILDEVGKTISRLQ